jgi:hypothetical protein
VISGQAGSTRADEVIRKGCVSNRIYSAKAIKTEKLWPGLGDLRILSPHPQIPAKRKRFNRPAE